MTERDWNYFRAGVSRLWSVRYVIVLLTALALQMLSLPVNAQSRAPNFVIASFEAERTDEGLAYQATLRNAGPVTANFVRGNNTKLLWRITVETLQGEVKYSVVGHSGNRRSLRAGESIKLRQTIGLPTSLRSGRFRACIQVDHDNRVPESNERDNKRCIRFGTDRPTRPKQPPQSDLQIRPKRPPQDQQSSRPPIVLNYGQYRNRLFVDMPRIGGGGGNRNFQHFCNTRSNEVMIGLTGSIGQYAASQVVDTIGVVCIQINPETGVWVGRSRTIGGGTIVMSKPFRSTCPRNWAVLGFSELRTGNVIDGLQLRCRPLLKTGLIAGRSRDLERIGGRGGELSSQLCDRVYPAIGVRGRRGSVIDSIGLRCQTIQPNAFQENFNADAIGHDWKNAYILMAYSAYAFPDILCGILDKTRCMQNRRLFERRFANRFGFQPGQVRIVGEEMRMTLTNTQAVVAADERSVYVILRGSEEFLPHPRGLDQIQVDKMFRDWITTNPRIGLQDWDQMAPGARVHSGFFEAQSTHYSQIAGLVRQFNRDGNKRVWIAGHSLGGAVATLIAARFQLSKDPRLAVQGIYTYGQPRVGNSAFRNAYNDLMQNGVRHQRWVNDADPVPLLVPPALGYVHVGRTNNILGRNVIELNEPERFLPVDPERFGDHLMGLYCKRIFRKANLEGFLPSLKCEAR